ncbi:hypothetical protein [Leptospira neocaledonica]|uniref:Uncharacterized protein n=1 Tax=Leptospira neocaledonica TaxID=2023192 RepID=A0A2M9ZVY5_9LEPT|nr:hypothetical protein [Leptospira neocaledonica]PJZ76224.1 hypothetical protein CH365_15500 [Leptospira neocaledonica]
MKVKFIYIPFTIFALFGTNCVTDKVKDDVKTQATFQCLAALQDQTATQAQKDSICILAAAAVSANN